MPDIVPVWCRERFAEAVWSSDLKPLQRFVALAFNNHSRSDGVAWMTYPRIRERTGMSRDAIARAIAGLVESGWFDLYEAGTQHKSPKYQLVAQVEVQWPVSRTADDSSSPSPGPLSESQQSVSRTAGEISSPSPGLLEVQESVSRTAESVASSPPPGPLGLQQSVSRTAETSSSPSPGLNHRSDQIDSSLSPSPGLLRDSDPKPFVIVANAVPDANRDEIRELVARFASKYNPGHENYWKKCASNGVFNTLLAQLRDEQSRERDQQLDAELARLRKTEPPCEHGTEAGKALHPTHGTPLCGPCRRGIPAPRPQSDDHPAASAAVAAWGQAYNAAGHRPNPEVDGTLPELVGRIHTHARHLMSVGQLPERDLLALATAAGAAGRDLYAEAQHRATAPAPGLETTHGN